MASLSDFLIEIGHALGYPGLFVLMFVNTAVGAPPSEFICIAFGAASRKGGMNIIVVILVATIANLMGTSLLFALARQMGRSRIEAFILRIHRSKFRFLASMAGWGILSTRRVNRLYEDHGYAIIFLGRLLPLVRSVVSIPAGLNRMAWTHFILLSAPGILIWVSFWSCVGYAAVGSARTFELTILLMMIVVLLWLAYLGLARLRQSRV